MNVLSAETLFKTVNDRPLFENVSFGLEKGERAGLIGSNGSGKSTLLKVLAGSVVPDGGTVTTARDTELSVLEQTVTFSPGDSVRDFLYAGNNAGILAFKRYNALLETGRTEDNRTELQELSDFLDATGGWNVESEFSSVLGELGLSVAPDTPMAALSGGMQKKVALAVCLTAKPTLLLLDEPTNHLDIETIEWLETYLKQSSATLIVVTHDRYFLDAVCTSIMELDGGRIYLHPGSFSSYLKRKADRLDAAQKEQARLNTVLRRELAWLERGPKARTGKDSGRKDRIEAMLAARRTERDENPGSFTSGTRRLGKKILDVTELGKRFGDKTVLEDFTFGFTKGQKIGLVGPNGSGKTTLLDLLSGRLSPDFGTVDRGVNTVFGYYDQLSRELPQEKPVLSYIEDIAPLVSMGTERIRASQFLTLFGFPPEQQRIPISLLSGGERRRLYLVRCLMDDPNFLLLDEPTNDLDLAAMENLERYVQDFTGCVLIASHDRAFLDCTCDRLFVFGWEEHRILSYPGPYSQWRGDSEAAAEERRRQESAAKERTATEESRRHRTKKGLTYRERQRFEQLGADIERLEAERAALERSFSTPAETELGTLAKRTERYKPAGKTLAELEEAWLLLAEKDE